MSPAASPLESVLENCRRRISDVNPINRLGEVVQVTGLVIESEGPQVSLGDL